MTKIFFLILGIAFVTGCKSESSDKAASNPPVTEFELSEEFPDSLWSGSGEATTGEEEPVQLTTLLSIENNVFFMETNTSTGYHSDSINFFRYTSKNKVEWLDQNQQKIGDCFCYSQACTCQAETNGMIIERIMSFSKLGLSIEDRGALNEIPFRNRLNLRLKQ